MESGAGPIPVKNEEGLLPLLLQAGRAFLRQKEWTEAASCARRVLAEVAEGSPGSRAEALDVLATSLEALEQHAQAEAAWEECLALSEKRQDHRGMARAACRLGTARRLRGDLDGAARALKDSLRYSAGLVPGPERADALEQLGLRERATGNLHDAERYLAEALRIYEALEDVKRRAALLVNLGNVFQDSGRLPEALDSYARALPLNEQINDRAAMATAHNNLAGVLHRQGDHGRAIEEMERARRIYQELGDERAIAITTGNLAVLHSIRGALPEAERLLGEAISILNRLGDRPREATFANNLAMVTRMGGRYDEAVRWADHAIRLHRESGKLAGIGKPLLNRARALLELGRTQEAAVDIEEGRRESERSEHVETQCEALVLEAWLALRQGRPDQAEECGARAAAAAEQRSFARSLADATRALAAVAVAQGAPDRARERFEKAEALWRKLADPYHTALCRLELGKLCTAAGADEAGAAHLRHAEETFATLPNPALRAEALVHLGLAELALDPGQARARLLQAAGLAEAAGRRDLAMRAREAAERGPHSEPAREATGRDEVQALLGLLAGAELPPALARAIEERWGLSASGVAETSCAAEPDLPRAGMIVKSPSMLGVLDLVARVAGTRASVLIRGESGTGKELIARAIHDQSGLAGAFIGISCPAIPRDLIEAELFGHEKGAFTGAEARRVGQVELADGGTLFLDEIGDMDLPAQTKLLRFLEQRDFLRIGGRDPVRVDVRLVAATSRDLMEDLRTGRFRADLFHRLNVIPIHLPPLRERSEELPALVRHFAAQFAAELRCAAPEVTEEALHALAVYPWPGNVRELRNLVYRLVATRRGLRITLAALPREYRPQHGRGPDVEADAFGFTLRPGETLPARVMGVEGSLIRDALIRSGWNQSLAARRLGVSESTLRDKIRRYAIQRPDPETEGDPR